jgi:uncharacterized protein (DUF2235 family)
LRVAVAVQRRGQRIGGYHMPRNLVLCFDGTNREFGQNNTNIVRLVQVLDRSSELQLLYYDPGVGTLPEPGAWGAMKKRISRIAGLAFGAGLEWKVQEAYEYLMDFWQRGDKVFLFGFSRGAYTARVLAGMLHALGLLPSGSQNLVPYVMRLFKAIRNERKHPEATGKAGDAERGLTKWEELCDQFRWTFSRPVHENDDERRFRVHFVGLWDTVSSVGWVYDPVKFPYTARNPSIDVIRHAISVDERRWFYRQNRMYRTGAQDLKEFWFPGVPKFVWRQKKFACANGPSGTSSAQAQREAEYSRTVCVRPITSSSSAGRFSLDVGMTEREEVEMRNRRS